MSAAPQPSHRPSRIGVALCVALVVIIALAVTIHLRATARFERTDNAYVRADISTVSPRVEGYVAEVLVEDHQHVQPGMALIRLVSDRLQAELARQQAVVARQLAALREHAARLAAQRARVSVSRARAVTAQAEVDRARNDAARSEQLVRRGWTAQQIHDDNRARLDIALARRAEAEAEALAEEAELEALASEAAALEATIADAEAAARLAEIALEDTMVRAPVAGVVANRQVRPGEFVRPGARLMAIVPLRGLWLEANFKETQIDAMRPGRPARFTVDGIPGEVFCGVVETVAPAAGAEFALLPPENASGNFTKIVRRVPVRIRIPADHPRHGDLRAGMSAVVSVAPTGAQSGPDGGLVATLLARTGLVPDNDCMR